MATLQEVIHRLEEGGGMRYFRIALAVLALLLLGVGYNWRGYRNMATQEAMDAAQLARNISEGKGYTTLFVRPLSIHMVKEHNTEAIAGVDGKKPDPGRLKEAHPDLANPPLYPLFLAGLMKVLPFNYTIPEKPAPFWTSGGRFARYQPDFIIAVVNQLLFLGVVVLTFFLARTLFDGQVAWFSAIILLGTELFWRFSVSGLSTLFLLLIFTGLLWCLVMVEREGREPKWGLKGTLLLAAAAGLLVGLGALTRYSFGWLIVPVILFLGLFVTQRRLLVCLTAFMVFNVVLTPWVARNFAVSGAPFGTASYAILEGTPPFPNHQLQRTLEPNLTLLSLRIFSTKLLSSGRQMIQNDLPKAAGSWVSALFLAGLLLSFRNPATRRLRYFLLLSLGLLALVQVMGRTQLSEDSPEINSENLLVLVAPMIIVYGTSLFFMLVDPAGLSSPDVWRAARVGFGLVACLPMILLFFAPRSNPVAYPPYYPPAIQTIAGWMKESEASMSDVPWAIAWYGRRQCIWLTRNAQTEFLAINDYQKPVAVLYLTPLTLDGRFLSQWVLAGEQSWGRFIAECVINKEVPPWFPLRKAQPGWLPHQIVLADWERWRSTTRQSDLP